MFRKIAFLFAVIGAFFLSCHNATDTTAPVSREQQLKDSIERYPDSSLLKEALIQYYRDNDNYGSALGVTEAYLKKDSNNARFWDIQATLYFENGDTLQAIRSFEKAASIYPAPQYLMSLGSLYAETQNPRALTMADALIKVPANRAEKESLFIKGLYYSTTGNCAQAIPYFDSAITVEYTFTMAYREKAICLYNEGKYKDALQVLQRAIEIVNTYEEAYYWMGRCNEKLGNKEQAIKDYQTALEIDNNYPEAREALDKLIK